jgi:DNA-directed RNA polymerase subunit RPC12/RpoP
MPKKSARKALSAYCPACGTDIFFRKLPRRGHYIACQECESLLEVVRLAPLTLNWAFEEPLEGEFEASGDFDRVGKNHNFDEAYNFAEVGDDWDDDWDKYDEDDLPLS